MVFSLKKVVTGDVHAIYFRPQFLFRQYQDLDVFRPSIEDLLSVLPSDGVVDLQPYFFPLTLDVTTAFLFGDSVNPLKHDVQSGQADFAESLTSHRTTFRRG